MRRQAAIQKAVTKALNAPAPKPAHKTQPPKKTRSWLAVGKWIIGAFGLASTFLSFAVLLPEVEVTQLDVINPRDQLSFPFQLKNAGLFPLTDIHVEWKNFEAHQTSQGQSHFKGGSIGNSRAVIKRLGRKEQATIPPPGWIFDTPTWDYATVEIRISFKHLLIAGNHRFRLEGRKVEGKLRWYVQPAK